MTAVDRLQGREQRALRRAGRRSLREAIRRDRRENPSRYGVNIPEVMLATVLILPLAPVLMLAPESFYWISVVPAAGGVVYMGSRSRLTYLRHLGYAQKQTAELQAKSRKEVAS